LVESFLAAAVEPQRWLGALGELAVATRSEHAQIIGIGPNYALDFNWVNDMSPEEHAAADRAELITPQTNYRVAAAATATSGSILCEDRYEAVKPHLVDDAYLDLCSDLRIPYGCQTDLLVGDDGFIGFALLRSHRDGPTTEQAHSLFASVRASAVAAVTLQVAIERQGHQLVAGTFEAMDAACFVLDHRMTVRAVTPGAETLLHQNVIRLVEGRPALPTPSDDRRLCVALSSVGEGRALSSMVTVADGPSALTLRLHRLPAREWNMGFAPFAILVVKRPRMTGARDLQLLRESYRLTASESEIAVLLSTGQTRDAICAIRGISRETLRSHLRSLFAKLGVARETEAIHLLHALLR
jgi:DNA-binding CsgD family transcriptional regulator